MQIAPGATPLFEKDQVFESNLAGWRSRKEFHWEFPISRKDFPSYTVIIKLQWQLRYPFPGNHPFRLPERYSRVRCVTETRLPVMRELKLAYFPVQRLFIWNLERNKRQQELSNTLIV
jgi:hypothetical protein